MGHAGHTQDTQDTHTSCTGHAHAPGILKKLSNASASNFFDSAEAFAGCVKRKRGYVCGPIGGQIGERTCLLPS